MRAFPAAVAISVAVAGVSPRTASAAVLYEEALQRVREQPQVSDLSAYGVALSALSPRILEELRVADYLWSANEPHTGASPRGMRDALKAAEHLVRQSPGLPLGWIFLARAADTMLFFIEVENPQDPEILALAEEAKTAAKKAHTLDPDPTLWLRYIEYYERQISLERRFQESALRAELDGLIAAHPSYCPAHQLAGRLTMTWGDYSSAVKHFEALMACGKTAGERAAARRQLANALMEAGRIEEARLHLRLLNDVESQRLLRRIRRHGD